jgi:MoaA/NifB/PqqE/SkfB family radical SAM enzyme
MKINQRLFDHYGIDTQKHMGIKTICARPWDTVLIDKRGSCYACECQSWLPHSIGNLQARTLDQILSSDLREHFKSSVADGSFKYCNSQRCSYILQGIIPPRDGTGTHIKNLRLAIDDSCNLRCPSCRKGMIFHKEGSAYNLGIRLADKINKWLHNYKHPIQVHIGSDGDPFASHVYRHFMAHTPKRDNIKYSILTNGLMFDEFHARVPHVINNLQELGVSIDGATKETYEKLRLGGRWEKINQNLRCMAELKQRLGFRWILHFVVQKDNFHEMMDIVDLGKKYGADRVWLNKIEDWNTMGDFKDQDIWLTQDFRDRMREIKIRIKAMGDRFIECPTLLSEQERDS